MKNYSFLMLQKTKTVNPKKAFIKLKMGVMLTLALVFGFNFSSRSCSPLNVPTLTSWNITGPNLNLNWTSNTIYNCTYTVQVELACISNPFSGTGPFF